MLRDIPQGLAVYWNSIKIECQLEKVASIYSENERTFRSNC